MSDRLRTLKAATAAAFEPLENEQQSPDKLTPSKLKKAKVEGAQTSGMRMPKVRFSAVGNFFAAIPAKMRKLGLVKRKKKNGGAGNEKVKAGAEGYQQNADTSQTPLIPGSP